MLMLYACQIIILVKSSIFQLCLILETCVTANTKFYFVHQWDNSH